MRVAFVDYSKPRFGVSNVVCNLANSMIDLGVDVFLFSPYDLNSNFQKKGIHNISTSSMGFYPFDILDFSRKTEGIIRRKYRKKFDVIHVNGPLTALRFFGDRLPIIATAHGTLYREKNASWKYPLNFLERVRTDISTLRTYFFEKALLTLADKVIAVSSGTKRELELMGIKSKRIVVIPNGVNTEFFKPMANKDIQIIKKRMDLIGSKIVLFVGNFSPLKGLHILIKCIPEVVSHHPNTIFLFSGAKSYLKSYDHSLRNKIKTLGVEKNVIFTGFVSQEKLVKLYNIADVFVSSSFSEGCALNILEAASCGTSVIASDVGGSRDVLADSNLLFSSGNHFELASKIVTLINNDSKRIKIGLNLRKRITNQFKWIDVAQRVIREYEIVKNMYSS